MSKSVGLLSLYRKVQEHMGWTEAKTTLWFKTVNPLTRGMTPLEFWNKNPERCERWIESLIKGEMP